MRIRFADEAADDLEEIEVYISRDNPAAAAATINRIKRTINLLRTFPTLGHVTEWDDCREVRVARLPYVVVYQTPAHPGNDLVILRCVHLARDRRGMD